MPALPEHRAVVAGAQREAEVVAILPQAAAAAQLAKMPRVVGSKVEAEAAATAVLVLQPTAAVTLAWVALVALSPVTKTLVIPRD